MLCMMPVWILLGLLLIGVCPWYPSWGIETCIGYVIVYGVEQMFWILLFAELGLGVALSFVNGRSWMGGNKWRIILQSGLTAAMYARTIWVPAEYLSIALQLALGGIVLAFLIATELVTLRFSGMAEPVEISPMSHRRRSISRMFQAGHIVLRAAVYAATAVLLLFVFDEYLNIDVW